MLLALALLQAAVAGPAPVATPQPAGEKMICKRVQPPGSRLPGKKTCQTQQQWEALASDGRDALATASQRR